MITVVCMIQQASQNKVSPSKGDVEGLVTKPGLNQADSYLVHFIASKSILKITVFPRANPGIKTY